MYIVYTPLMWGNPIDHTGPLDRSLYIGGMLLVFDAGFLTVYALRS